MYPANANKSAAPEHEHRKAATYPNQANIINQFRHITQAGSAPPAADVPRRDEALRLARAALMPEQGPGIEYPIYALGPLAGVAERIAQGVQCDPALAGQSVLAAVALLAQSIANVRTLDGAIKPLSLYAMTVALSGDGKDSADRIALRPIFEWQREAARAYEQARKQAEESGEPVKEPFRVAADITIEGLRQSFQKGIASQGIFSTESGTLLAGHAMSAENRIKTAAGLCGLWDRGHLSVSRVTTGRVEKFGLRLSMHLLVQPAAVVETMVDEGLAAIGFWPRFLLAWPAPLPPRKYRPFRPEQDPVIVGYWERMAELLRPVADDLDGSPVLEMSEAAESRLARFFEEAEHESRLGGWQGIRPFGLRATELAARIAGVLTVYAGGSEIDEAAIINGITLVRYSLSNWRAALEDGRADPVAQHAFTLYRWLLERGEPVKRGDILRLGPAALRSKSRRDEAVDRLEACGLIIQIRDRLAANSSPTHLRKSPQANEADVGIRKDSQAVRIPETLDPRGFSQDSQLSQPRMSEGGDTRTIRKDSQAVRIPETLDPRGFSQDSQLSHTPSEGDVARSVRWRLHFANRDPVEIVCWPPASLKEVLDSSDATKAEPLSITPV
jgi:hypothetical protein